MQAAQNFFQRLRQADQKSLRGGPARLPPLWWPDAAPGGHRGQCGDQADPVPPGGGGPVPATTGISGWARVAGVQPDPA